jgi:hypothetical protein
MQQGYLSHFITVPNGIPYTIAGSPEVKTHRTQLKTLVKAHPKEGCYWMDQRGRVCHTEFANLFEGRLGR